MAKVSQRLYPRFLAEHIVARNVLNIEQVSRPEGLLCRNQQIMFAAKVIFQSWIEDKTPIDVPLPCLIMGQSVDDQIVIVFRQCRRMVLLSGNYDIEVETFVQRLIFRQTLADCPGTQRCHAPGDWGLRCKLNEGAVVVRGERFCNLGSLSRPNNSDCQYSQAGQLLYIRSQHSQ